jgi:hypothetical protein
VQCRLISEADGPGEESRAMVVQARTLEFYGQYGFAGEVFFSFADHWPAVQFALVIQKLT